MLDLPIQCFQLLPNLFLIVCTWLCTFSQTALKYLKSRIKEQKLCALEIKYSAPLGFTDVNC